MNRMHFNQAKTLASHIALAIGITALVACGGGGGGSSKSSASYVSTTSSMSSSSSSVAPDTTPDDFSFTSQTDVTRGDAIISNTVTIAGIDAVTPVSITNGEYAIGDADEFVTTAGSITVGQTIKVRVTAPGGFDETQAAELNVGGVKATFSVTTEKRDTEPKAFTFNPETNVAFDSEHTSGEIEVKEINDTAEISITNGFYSVNNGEFTDAVGTVELTDMVKVKGIAASKTDTTKDVTLTIGGISGVSSGVFSITTFSDTTPPSVNIAFPPPVSKTVHDFVIVRGTVMDDYNDVGAMHIFVNGNDSGKEILIDRSVDPALWSAEIDLVAGVNLVEISVEDEVGNQQVKAASSKLVKEEFDKAFPNNEAPFYPAVDTVVYRADDGYRVLTVSHFSENKLIETKLNTGVREEIIINSMPQELGYFTHAAINDENDTLYLIQPAILGVTVQGVVSVDMSNWSVKDYLIIPEAVTNTIMGLGITNFGEGNRLIIGSSAGDVVGEVDISLLNYSEFSTNETPSNSVQYPFDQPRDVVVNAKSNNIYVLNGQSSEIYLLNADGSREFVGGVAGSSIDGWGDNIGMSFYEYGGHNSLVVVGQGEDTLLIVDVVDGERSLLPIDNEMPFSNALSVATHSDLGYALVEDVSLNALFAVDLENGQRVVVSKSN